MVGGGGKGGVAGETEGPSRFALLIYFLPEKRTFYAHFRQHRAVPRKHQKFGDTKNPAKIEAFLQGLRRIEAS